LILKKATKWMHFGSTVLDEYDSIIDLLCDWKTGEFLGHEEKERLFKRLGLL